MLRIFRPVWLGGRIVSVAFLCIAVAGVVTSMKYAQIQRQEAAAEKEARLQELRKSDPTAYLSDLKARGDSRWEPEFQVLDNAGYEVFLAERRRSEEAARSNLIFSYEAIREQQIANAILSHPEAFVSIENFTPSKEGWVTFIIKNKWSWPVKDVEITCADEAPSGTTIGTNTRTIYQRFDPGQTRRIDRFNMGFRNSQATRISCHIISVVPLR